MENMIDCRKCGNYIYYRGFNEICDDCAQIEWACFNCNELIFGAFLNNGVCLDCESKYKSDWNDFAIIEPEKFSGKTFNIHFTGIDIFKKINEMDKCDALSYWNISGDFAIITVNDEKHANLLDEWIRDKNYKYSCN